MTFHTISSTEPRQVINLTYGFSMNVIDLFFNPMVEGDHTWLAYKISFPELTRHFLLPSGRYLEFRIFCCLFAQKFPTPCIYMCVQCIHMCIWCINMCIWCIHTYVQTLCVYTCVDTVQTVVTDFQGTCLRRMKLVSEFLHTVQTLVSTVSTFVHTLGK